MNVTESPASTRQSADFARSRLAKTRRDYSHWLRVLALVTIPLLSLVAYAHATSASSPISTSHGETIEAAIKTIYVKEDATGANNGTTWNNAFNSLQAGLDAAAAGDEIWVAEGIYTPTLQTVITDSRSATFTLIQGVALFGGFAGNETYRTQRDWHTHPTILSGDLQGNDLGFTNNDENSYHVVTALNVNQNTRLDGFVVQGGNADGVCATCYSIFSLSLFDPKKGPSADTTVYGGGLFASSANPVLANLIFTGNYAIQGGGQYNDNSSGLMVNCAWIGNHAEFAGGLRNYYSNPTIANAIFDGNTAGGSIAGGLYNTYSNPQIINATFINNTDNFEAKSILNDNGSQLNIKNSIIWGEDGIHIKNQSGGTTKIFNSLILGGCVEMMTCVDILDEDPLFIDADGEDGLVGTLDDDLRLNGDSNAVDRGDNSAVPQDTLDLDQDGNTTEPLPQDWAAKSRFVDAPKEDFGSGNPPLVDLGAFETQNNYICLYLPVVKKN